MTHYFHVSTQHSALSTQTQSSVLSTISLHETLISLHALAIRRIGGAHCIP